MKKREMALWVMLLMFIVAALGSSVSVDAASKDVTKQFSHDKNMKKICKVIAAYTTAMDLSGNPPKGTRTIRMNNANQLSIAAFVRFNEKGDIGYTSLELKRETKALFGKPAVVNSTKIKKLGKTDMLVCRSIKKYVREPYMYCGGEFGDGFPLYKIKKVTMQNKDTYKVLLENRLGYYGEKGSDKVGTTTLTLRKMKGSRYGFVVKKISYK